MLQEKLHYEKILKERILPDIKEAEEEYQQLEQKRKVYCCDQTEFCIKMMLMLATFVSVSEF